MVNVLMSGKNVLHGEVVFSNQKTAIVSFSVPFKKIPSINLTLEDTSTNPPYKLNLNVNGFTIAFSQKFTGTVDWMAMEK